MKSVLMSIRPKWCNLIASGKKTIEVRKTKPNIETPFKCYIYCTSVKNLTLGEYVKVHQKTCGKIDDWNEKVIGELCAAKLPSSRANFGTMRHTSAYVKIRAYFGRS